MKKQIKALGVMNGTSLDAIDYSLVSVSQDFKKIRLIKHWQKKIPDELRDRLLLAARNKLTTFAISNLDFDLGRLYGKHIRQIAKLNNFDLVGLHGQTIFHEGGQATFQIGNPGFAFKACHKPIYYDFSLR